MTKQQPPTNLRRAGYQAIFKKAAAEMRTFTIECSSHSQAKHFQMEMYRAVKFVRERPELDPELAKAIDCCSVRTKNKGEPGDHILEIGPKMMPQGLADLLQEVGVPQEDLREAPNPAEFDLQQSAERLRQMTEKKPEPVAGKLGAYGIRRMPGDSHG